MTMARASGTPASASRRQKPVISSLSVRPIKPASVTQPASPSKPISSIRKLLDDLQGVEQRLRGRSPDRRYVFSKTAQVIRYSAASQYRRPIERFHFSRDRNGTG